MDILVFKILTDVCFYMAMFMPLFLSGPLWVRVLLFLALASWCVWLLVCWKKRNMEERAHDSLMTEARLLLAAGCIQWLSLGTGQGPHVHLAQPAAVRLPDPNVPLQKILDHGCLTHRAAVFPDQLQDLRLL